MKTISLPLAASMVIVAFITGLAGGYFITPEYQTMKYMNASMNLGTADSLVDLRYINAMAAHHRGAILLAQQIQQTTQRDEIKKLAADIQVGEPKLIDELYGWKREWYKDGRKVRDPLVAELGPSDEHSDLRFLNALIAHHEAGIVMTKEIRTKSSRKEILDNADAVEKFLTDSAAMLKDWRFQWYGVK